MASSADDPSLVAGVALWDYVAVEDNEVSVAAGDSLLVHPPPLSNDHWAWVSLEPQQQVQQQHHHHHHQQSSVSVSGFIPRNRLFIHAKEAHGPVPPTPTPTPTLTASLVPPPLPRVQQETLHQPQPSLPISSAAPSRKRDGLTLAANDLDLVNLPPATPPSAAVAPILSLNLPFLAASTAKSHGTINKSDFFSHGLSSYSSSSSSSENLVGLENRRTLLFEQALYPSLLDDNSSADSNNLTPPPVPPLPKSNAAASATSQPPPSSLYPSLSDSACSDIQLQLQNHNQHHHQPSSSTSKTSATSAASSSLSSSSSSLPMAENNVQAPTASLSPLVSPTKPAANIQSPTLPPPADVSQILSKDPEWLQVRNEETGELYYWNTRTDATRWSTPSLFIPCILANKDGVDNDEEGDGEKDGRALSSGGDGDAIITASTSTNRGKVGSNGDFLPSSPSQLHPPPPRVSTGKKGDLLSSSTGSGANVHPAVLYEPHSDPVPLASISRSTIKKQGIIGMKPIFSDPAAAALSMTVGGGGASAPDAWRTLHVVACGGVLACYDPKTPSTPVHVIPLASTSVHVVSNKQVTKKKHAFSVKAEAVSSAATSPANNNLNASPNTASTASPAGSPQQAASIANPSAGNNGCAAIASWIGISAWVFTASSDSDMKNWMDIMVECRWDAGNSRSADAVITKLLSLRIDNMATPATQEKKSFKIPDKLKLGSASGKTGGSSTAAGIQDGSEGSSGAGAISASISANDLSLHAAEGTKKMNIKLGGLFGKKNAKDKQLEINVAVFGGTLTELALAEKKPIPAIIEKCVREVDRRGLLSQGIYRLSGNTSTIQKLKASFDGHEDVKLHDEGLDINAVSGVLKLYFRELKNPLLPFEMYSQFVSAIDIQDYNNRLIFLKQLIQSLPRVNYDVLEYLMRHLQRVVTESEVNKMETSNLAIVFGPTLVRPPNAAGQTAYDNIMAMAQLNQIVEHIIVQTDWLFDEGHKG